MVAESRDTRRKKKKTYDLLTSCKAVTLMIIVEHARAVVLIVTRLRDID